jgi:serine/threonine-protein kinase RsbW
MFVALELPPRPWTLAGVRHTVDQFLTAENVDEEMRDRLAIVLSEACTNVIRHAAAPDPYRVRVDIRGDSCVIEVADHGVGFDPGQGQPEMPAPGASVDGRGLPIIHSLVHRLTLERIRPRGMRLRAVTPLHRSTAGTRHPADRDPP